MKILYIEWWLLKPVIKKNNLETIDIKKKKLSDNYKDDGENHGENVWIGIF